jgi:spectinomycin phosphotransferase/16S rRNA (guanine(1405)-N(7))-methyltransferase
VAELVADLHQVPIGASPSAREEDFAIGHRTRLEATMDGGGDEEAGPYARPAAALIRDHAKCIGAALRWHDELVAETDDTRDRFVLTHGETHPGNAIRTANGYVLVDWDTALRAPRERDLWNLDPGDGSILAAYADRTGTVPEPRLIELYRLRWDLRDLAEYVNRFALPHRGSPDDDNSWSGVVSVVDRFAASGR